MLSTEVDSYLRTVAEAATAQEAISLWQPGPVQSTPLKGLQSGPKKGKTHRGGAQGRNTTRGLAGAVDIAADVAVAPADEAASSFGQN